MGWYQMTNAIRNRKNECSKIFKIIFENMNVRLSTNILIHKN